MKVYTPSFLRRQEPQGFDNRDYCLRRNDGVKALVFKNLFRVSLKRCGPRFLRKQEPRVGTNTPVKDLFRGSLEGLAKGRNPGIAQGSYNICPGVLQLPGRARMLNPWIIDSIRVED